MKKLLIGFWLISLATASSADSFQGMLGSSGPISPDEIRKVLNSLWMEEKLNYADVERRVRENGDLLYANVATCVSKRPNKRIANKIFYAGIAIGIHEQTAGPFTAEYLSFNALSRGSDDFLNNALFESSSMVQSYLCKLGSLEEGIETNNYGNDKGGAILSVSHPQFNNRAIKYVILKPIPSGSGLLGVKYLININDNYTSSGYDESALCVF
jgi:hypothetical protein